ncbi:MAG: hypothetical protein ABSC94_05215 [Polyangiaceae bacterium]
MLYWIVIPSVVSEQFTVTVQPDADVVQAPPSSGAVMVALLKLVVEALSV